MVWSTNMEESENVKQTPIRYHILIINLNNSEDYWPDKGIQKINITTTGALTIGISSGFLSERAARTRTFMLRKFPCRLQWK